MDIFHAHFCQLTILNTKNKKLKRKTLDSWM